MTQIRAAIYCRISLASEGDYTKTDDQERLCREVCDRRGWEVAAVYTDHSRSAWQRNRKRPGWDAMLAAVNSGAVRAIVVYHGDRLVRQPFDLETLIGLSYGKGIMLASVAGQRDLSSPDDLFILRIEAAMACRESDNTSRRKKAGYERMRRDGRVRPGGYRAFGYTRGDTALEPAEAAVVRELARRVLGGESVGALTRDLGARGITTTAGNPFSHTTVREMLTRPRYAGLMPDGVSPAAWPPVLGRGEWEQLQAVITARAADCRPDNARRYLLSGIAECGACGARLAIHHTMYGGKRKALAYSCKACRKVNRSQPLLDAYVTARVTGRLNHPGNPAPSPADDTTARELMMLTARRAETAAVIESLADHPGESLAVLARGLASFDQRIAELRQRAGDGARQRLLASHAGTTPEQFAALDLAARRALVAACYRIVVLPVGSGAGRGFDPDGVIMSPL